MDTLEQKKKNMMKMLRIMQQLQYKKLKIVQDPTGWEKETSDSIKEIKDPRRDQYGLFLLTISQFLTKEIKSKVIRSIIKQTKKDTCIFHTAQKTVELAALACCGWQKGTGL